MLTFKVVLQIIIPSAISSYLLQLTFILFNYIHISTTISFIFRISVFRILYSIKEKFCIFNFNTIEFYKKNIRKYHNKLNIKLCNTTITQSIKFGYNYFIKKSVSLYPVKE